jgi:hypothetical protein
MIAMADEFPIFPMASLYLPGTVALPSPFPTVGTVWLPPPDSEHIPGLNKGTEVLAIGALAPPHSTIVRYVRTQFISAMFLLNERSDAEEFVVNWKHGKWLYTPSYEDLREKLASKNRAIVYVPESAPVMTHTVFGATAAESAEYLGFQMSSCD